LHHYEMNKLYPWQSKLWQRWMGLRSRLPHAILLKGPQGVGKYDFALNLSQSLLCELPIADGMACSNCPSCHWFKNETHPDFRLLQPDSLSEVEEGEEREAGKKKPSRQISVDQIRSLANFANLSAHRGGYRLVLIHPAEAMNTNAANALLKTLEEPSANMLIILVSHRPQQLLPTILSRCLLLEMPLPSQEESTAWLQQQGISNPESLLAHAGFAPLQAACLDEDAGAVDERSRFLQEIKQPYKLNPFALAEHIQKIEPAKVIYWLQQWCYDITSAKLTGQVRYNSELSELINKISINVTIFNLVQFNKELLVAKRESSHPLNAKLQFESLLLSYCQMMLAK
jgi:DNA polymerase-3 subunit delta'